MCGGKNRPSGTKKKGPRHHGLIRLVALELWTVKCSLLSGTTKHESTATASAVLPVWMRISLNPLSTTPLLLQSKNDKNKTVRKKRSHPVVPVLIAGSKALWPRCGSSYLLSGSPCVRRSTPPRAMTVSIDLDLSSQVYNRFATIFFSLKLCAQSHSRLIFARHSSPSLLSPLFTTVKDVEWLVSGTRFIVVAQQQRRYMRSNKNCQAQCGNLPKPLIAYSLTPFTSLGR